MTVGELKQLLEEYDDDMIVATENGGLWEITDVSAQMSHDLDGNDIEPRDIVVIS